MAMDYESDMILFQEIKQFIHTYVDIDAKSEQWSTYYVLLSWIYDKLPVCPYLSALGPSNAGKTRFVQTVGSICYKPFIVSGSITASPLFRILDKFRGTLGINEFDHIGDYNAEIIVILNNGYEKGLPVARTEGDDKREVKMYEVYGPKIFSSRKRKSDWAFESRLITIQMKETKRKDIPTFLMEDFHKKALELRNKLLMFRFRHYNDTPILHDDKFPDIKGRLKQTLVAIASVITEEDFFVEAQKFAKSLETELKTSREFDLDNVIYQVLVDFWNKKTYEPTVQSVALKAQNILGLDKLSAKSVGKIVRDEHGFKTERKGADGNFVILFVKYPVFQDRILKFFA